LLMGGPR